MCHVCFFYIGPCAQSQGTCPFVPTAVLVACVCICAHLASAGLMFAQLVDSNCDHWWMMLTVPCWCCACAKNCDIPSLPAELISCPVFHHDCLCLCRLPFTYVPLTLEVADCLDIVACYTKSFRLCVPLDFYFKLQDTSIILKWWHSFYFFFFTALTMSFIFLLLSVCNRVQYYFKLL